MIYWPRYVGDWKDGTSALSPMQKGIYGELLDYCYSKETALPAQFDMICRIAGATTPAEQRATEIVLKMFFVKNGVGFVNDRVQEELKKWQDKSGKAANSANKRWGKT